MKEIIKDKTHSRYAPSAAHRWMACPGSVTLCESQPKKKSVYAEEGTAAHQLAELCIKNNVHPSYYLNKGILIPDSINKYVVDQDMVDAVEMYVETVLVDQEIDDFCGVEEPFNLSWLHEGMYGSNDFYRFKHETKKLTVYDYKHGKGVIVEAEWNPQLMLYAVGAIKNIADRLKTPLFDSVVEDVEIVIVQPRGLHSDTPVRRWTIKAIDLMFWAVNVARPCAIATDTQKDKFIPGDHCHFCNAKAVCTAIYKRAAEVACVSFEDKTMNFPDVALLNPKDVSKVLQIAPAFSEWIDAVKASALEQLVQGKEVPGYKLVKKRADRKWISEEAVEETVGSQCLGVDLFETKLLSVAKMEKALKEKGFKAATLVGLWEKPDNGFTIAPESDKREQVSPPALAFDVVEADFFAEN